ncbi:MAG: pectin acetylesterase-family hydrolase [Myxococcota bacterium]|nr:pectin acetylesterase-family hydrolase [Myxococcota bacterium]
MAKWMFVAMVLTLGWGFWGCDEGDSDSSTNIDTDTGTDTDTDADTDTDTDTDADTDTDTDTDSDTDTEEGEPLPDGEPGEWIWVEIEGSKCRGGSPAGLSVRYSETSDETLFIYLEGGGACFNLTTCMTSLASIPSLARKPPSPYGMYDLDNPENPFAGFNGIYVPYCTGDVHTGSAENVDLPGVGVQQYVGADNFKLFLNRIVPTFPNVKKVVITGISAGGFGAAFNTVSVFSAFGDDVQIINIDDSGPPMRDPYFPACLQELVRDLWGMNENIPLDCTACFEEGGIHALLAYAANMTENGSFGLMSAHEDAVMRQFWAFGNNDCDPGMFPSYDGEKYLAGLEDFLSYMQQIDFGGVYYYSGTAHTKLISGDMYRKEVNGVRLVDWISDVIDGNMYHVTE